jgi:hypothetical protein
MYLFLQVLVTLTCLDRNLEEQRPGGGNSDLEKQRHGVKGDWSYRDLEGQGPRGKGTTTNTDPERQTPG